VGVSERDNQERLRTSDLYSGWRLPVQQPKAVWLVWAPYDDHEPVLVAAHLTEEAAWLDACKRNGWGLRTQAHWQWLELAPHAPWHHTRINAARMAAWQDLAAKVQGMPATVVPMRLGAEGVPARWA